jgi:hypothetical protein
MLTQLSVDGCQSGESSGDVERSNKRSHGWNRGRFTRPFYREECYSDDLLFPNLTRGFLTETQCQAEFFW